MHLTGLPGGFTDARDPLPQLLLAVQVAEPLDNGDPGRFPRLRAAAVEADYDKIRRGYGRKGRDAAT